MGSIGLELSHEEFLCSEGFLCNENFNTDENILVKVPDQSDIICAAGEACPRCDLKLNP